MGILAAVLGIWFSSSLVKGDSKAVTTSLTTKWSSTPLLLETSEFLSEEGQEKFWNFVEASQNIKTSEHDGSDYSSYHEMLKVACQTLSPLQQNLLKFSLSLRSYSATVQAFQQIAADEPPPKGCTLFFSVHGEKTCEFDSLGSLLQAAAERPKPFLFKGDHKYPVSDPESPVVILYAEIGSEEFYRYHKRLVLKAEAGEITYVLRHYIANPSQEKVYLSGYGVELAIKSTEYKAKDDTQVKDILSSDLKSPKSRSSLPRSFGIMFFTKRYPRRAAFVSEKCWTQWGHDSELDLSNGTTTATNFSLENWIICGCKAVPLPYFPLAYPSSEQNVFPVVALWENRT